MTQRDLFQVCLVIRSFITRGQSDSLSNNDKVNNIMRSVINSVLGGSPHMANGIRYTIHADGGLIYEPKDSFPLVAEKRDVIDYEALNIFIANDNSTFNSEKKRFIECGKIKSTESLHQFRTDDGRICYGTIESIKRLGVEEDKIKEKKKSRCANVSAQEMYLFLCSMRNKTFRNEEEVWSKMKTMYKEELLNVVDRVMKNTGQLKEF